MPTDKVAIVVEVEKIEHGCVFFKSDDGTLAYRRTTDVLSGTTVTPREVELIEALKPFAQYADPQRRIPADVKITMGSGIARRQLVMGDCYRAASLCSGLVWGAQAMTVNRIEEAHDEWRKTLTVLERPTSKDAFGQGYIAGWCAKDRDDKLRQLANDLKRNSSGGDDYPWEFAREIARRIEEIIG